MHFNRENISAFEFNKYTNAISTGTEAFYLTDCYV